MSNQKIGIIVNVYNDSDLLIKLLPKLYNIINNNDFYILIADDSKNKSKTKLILKNFLYKNIFLFQRNKISKYNERCLATRKVMEYFYNNKEIKYFVEIDTDGAQHPRDIKKGYMNIKQKNLDLIIFSKYKKGSIISGRTFLRKFISLVITFLCKIIFKSNISDYSNSFRFYSAKSIKILLQNKLRFYGPIQHIQNLVLLLKKQVKIEELSCVYKEMPNRKSSISNKELLQSLKNFLKFIIINLFKILCRK